MELRAGECRYVGAQLCYHCSQQPKAIEKFYIFPVLVKRVAKFHKEER